MKLKRKLYTRGEKQAVREIFRVTKGFKEFPKTGNPKDVLRFQKFIRDLNAFRITGDKRVIDRENAKTLLQNAGLTKSASEVDHIMDKYTNKRALVRLKKLKDRENPDYSFSSLIAHARGRKKYYRLVREGSDMDKRAYNNLNKLARNHNDKINYDKIKKDASRRGINVFEGGSKKSKIPSSDAYFIPADNYINTIKPPMGYDLSRKSRRSIVLGNNRRNHATLAHEYGHARSSLSPVKDYSNYTVPGSYLNREYHLHSLKRKAGLSGRKLKTEDRGKNILIGAKKNFDNILSQVTKSAEENIANSYAIARYNMYKSSPSKRKILEKAIKNNQDSYNSMLGANIRSIEK